MATDIPDDEREEIKLTIDVILLALGWNRKTFASKTGIHRSNVSKIANGKRRPQPRTWRKIETGTRLPLAEVKAVVPLIRRLRALAAGRLPPARRPAAAASLAHTVGAAVEAALQREAPPVPSPTVQRVQPPAPRPTAGDRDLAAELWERLRGRDHSARLALVEETPKYQTWALAERLCHESVAEAADDPKEAVRLAMLALRLVEVLSGEPAWLCLLAGYVWAFVGNARRVDSDLPGAEEAFRRAWKLWKEGAAADAGLLDGSRLLDLEASLLRAQRKRAAALERLDQALAMHPAGEGRGRVLLKKGFTLEQMGRYEEAVEALREAALWIDRERQPRWYFGMRFNSGVCLCHTGRHAEAAALLPELRAFTGAGLRAQGIDPWRLRWLEGRIAGGLGSADEGIEALAEARTAFAAKEIRYDEALISLELAGLYLEQGRTAEVKELVAVMEPVFRAQGVHVEAQKALALFRRAVELETVTLELVRRLVAFLYRAQHDLELRFEAAS
ncbi:MAG TPA: helix-turn-helix transcriptional regulator [Thermoanaerobaculia bacterium]|jgi:tetratricopeptide (TPR) repeat protein|nr:helix-turn-helix transcriptional regulator [Thermoanaerobaculia bacterium]